VIKTSRLLCERAMYS